MKKSLNSVSPRAYMIPITEIVKNMKEKIPASDIRLPTPPKTPQVQQPSLRSPDKGESDRKEFPTDQTLEPPDIYEEYQTEPYEGFGNERIWPTGSNKRVHLSSLAVDSDPNPYPKLSVLNSVDSYSRTEDLDRDLYKGHYSER